MKPIVPPAETSRYAEAVLRVGLSLRKGDDLVVHCQPAHRELAAAVVECAYRLGARTVDVRMTDPHVRAARLRAASTDTLGELAPWQPAFARGQVRETTCSLFIFGESDPGALGDVPAEKVAAEMTAVLRRLPDVRRAARLGRRRWSIVAWPAPAWAAQVYPGVAQATAERRLARDLFSFCRVGPNDGSGSKALRDHLETVRRRARRLTALKLERLEVRGPGTDLSVALHPDNVWAGGGGRNAFGLRQAPNLPTEECFTSPVAASTEGTFRCSRPLMFQGRLIDGIAGEFRGGRLVRLRASRGRDRDWLAGYLSSVDGAERLGEVALVDATSRIGQKRRIYFNTLLDENAAAHIAFGSGFAFTRRDYEQTRSRRGVNDSRAHLDVMIGTDDLEATGVAARGRRVTLVCDGLWRI